MEEKSGKKNHGEGITVRHLGSIWEASQTPSGSIWEACKKHLGRLAETKLAGVAKRRKIMRDQYVIVKISISRTEQKRKKKQTPRMC